MPCQCLALCTKGSSEAHFPSPHWVNRTYDMISTIKNELWILFLNQNIVITDYEARQAAQLGAGPALPNRRGWREIWWWLNYSIFCYFVINFSSVIILGKMSFCDNTFIQLNSNCKRRYRLGVYSTRDCKNKL